MTKKALALLLSLTLILTVFFNGCGNNQQAASQPPSHISPLLWKVEGKNGNTLYLFGTIHCGDERSDKVLEKLSGRLAECKKLAVEFDAVEYNEKAASDPLSAAEDIAQFMYTDGTTIKDHISAKLYKDCVRIMKDAGTYNSLFDYYNPAYWSQLLTQSLISKSKLSTDYAMDTLLLKKAKETGMKIVELESAKKQFAILNSISEEFQVKQLSDTVESEGLFDYELNELYDAWLEGEEFTLEETFSEEYENDENDEDDEVDEDDIDDGAFIGSEYEVKFIVERNIAMAKKADKLLSGKDNAFLAVGTAHMLGDQGIINLLESKGYTVKKAEL